MEKYLSKKEVAELFGVSIGTVDNWRRQGMPSVKIGRTRRFTETDIKNWITKTNDK